MTKLNIPKRIRALVWKQYIGKKWKGKCYVEWCNNKFDVLSSWHVGHNLPESKGGTLNIKNLRPICCDCNLGMGNRYTIDEWSDFYKNDIPDKESNDIQDKESNDIPDKESNDIQDKESNDIPDKESNAVISLMSFK